MSQKKLHLNNRKLRRELGKQIPLHIWYQVTRARLKTFPWSWFNRVFPLYPRPSRIRRSAQKIVEFARDVREWVRVVFKKKSKIEIRGPEKIQINPGIPKPEGGTDA